MQDTSSELQNEVKQISPYCATVILQATAPLTEFHV